MENLAFQILFCIYHLCLQRHCFLWIGQQETQHTYTMQHSNDCWVETFLYIFAVPCILLAGILCNSKRHFCRSFSAQIGNETKITREYSPSSYNCFLPFTQISYRCYAKTARDMFTIAPPSAVVSACLNHWWQWPAFFQSLFPWWPKNNQKANFHCY